MTLPKLAFVFGLLVPLSSYSAAPVGVLQPVCLATQCRAHRSRVDIDVPQSFGKAAYEISAHPRGTKRGSQGWKCHAETRM